MASQFSENGKYFAHLSIDGKLKIWDTVSNSFEQEFTPDFHLTTPCTCLHFIPAEVTTNKGSPSPKKKKRRESESSLIPNIALGTTSGLLLVYSISKANVDFTINSETSQSISCLSSASSNVLYSAASQHILEWNLNKRTLKSKWKGGNEIITAILEIPYSNEIVTASKIIKVWNVEKKEVLRTFTGHSSDVMFLHYVNPRDTEDAYLLSGSKGDRILSCWNLSGATKNKNAVASYQMEDVVQNVSVNVCSDGVTNIAATVRSGVVHVYQQKLNGKCGKPIKPKTTVKVVSDTGQNGLVSPIRIVGAVYKDDETLCIGHGNEILLTFENTIVDTNQKVMPLIRKDPRLSKTSKEEQISKTKTPLVENDVHYLTPQNSSLGTSKRKNDGAIEVPMEKRLENLTLNKLDITSKVPKMDNVAQLLIQGLHSKDKNILRTVLCKRDENVIRNTVKRLPITAFVPLIQELSSFVQGKTLSSQIGALWLKNILQIHASILMANPDLSELLGSVLGGIENRLFLQNPLNRLRGRLDLLVSQVSPNSIEENNENEESLLVFNDKDSSDSDAEDFQLDIQSESEIEEWEEDSNAEEEIQENNHEKGSDSDLEMSIS